MDVSEIMELMEWLEEPLEEILRPKCFREVPGATRANKCQQENEASAGQPISILSKPIVIYDYFDTYESIDGVFKSF